jgi:hypothetical protein
MALGKRLINTGAAAAAACATDSTDPFGDSSGVALYSLDYDASTAPDGTDYSGSPTNVEFGVGGQINYGARFNGSSSYIDLGTSLLNSRSAFSVSTWVNFDNLNTQNFIFYTSESGTGGNVGFYDFGNGSIYFQPDASTSANRGYISNSGIYTTDEWVHIVMVFDGSATGNSNRLKAYIQGTERTLTYEGTIPSSSGTSTANSWIGGRSSTKFSGDIDQVRVFSKALSPDEVATLWNSGNGEIPCVYECTTDDVNYPFSDGTNVEAYYKLDNSSEDYSAGGNDGSDTNIEYRFGRFGQAAVFNGSSSVITLGATHIPSSSNFSFSCWVNKISSAYATILGQATSGASGRFSFNYNASNQFTIGIETTTVITTSAFGTNQWHHLVFVRDGNDYTIYVNGSSAGTGTNSVALQQRTTDLGGLTGFGGVANPFNGSIDQVRIYSTALTSSQVTELYEEKPCADTSNFKTVLYEGTSAKQYISNVGFDLDVDDGGDGGLVWLKRRDVAANHRMLDSVRGDDLEIYPNLTNAEANFTTLNWGFEANGFSFNTSDASYNASGGDYVAWVWKGGGDAVVGSSSQATNVSYSANQDAGFSIVKFTSSTSTSAVMNYISHGLNAPPEMVIYKRLDSSQSWRVAHDGLTDNYRWIILNEDDPEGSASPQTFWDNTSTNIGVRSNYSISRSAPYIAYCFHSVAGYSKIGSYEGSGSSGKEITGLGFAPSFVMIKNVDDTGSWIIHDKARSPSNPSVVHLRANSNSQDDSGTGEQIDFDDDGFTLNGTGQNINHAETYIYMAFK